MVRAVEILCRLSKERSRAVPEHTAVPLDGDESELGHS